MLIYILIFPTLFVFYSFTHNSSFKSRNLFLIVSFSFLAIIAAIRSPLVGADTRTYQNLFSQLISGFYTGAGNTPVYNYYSEIIGRISNDPQIITAFNSIITCSLIGIFIYRSKVNSLFSTSLFVAMYFYADSLNGARQYLAIAVMINGFLFLLERKWKTYVLLSAIAVGIHSTSLVTLLFIPIVLVKWTPKRIGVMLILTSTLAFMYSRLSNLFILLFSRYQAYMESDINVNGGVSVNTQSQGKIVFYYLFLIITVVLLYYLSSRYKVMLTDIELRISLVFIGGLIAATLMFNIILVQRIMWYFLIFGIYYFPMMYQRLKEKLTNSGIIFVFLFVVVFLVYIFRLFANYDGIVPYTTFLG